MSYYIFRQPAGTPELTAESLTTWMQRAYRGRELRYGDHRKIGTTVTVTYHGPLPGQLPAENRFTFRLYDLDLAVITRTRIAFTAADDPHMATMYWVTQILHDNAIPKWVGRRRRRKSDGPGPMVPRGMAGVLEAGGKPVFGSTFRVGDIAAKRKRDAEQAAQRIADRERFAGESRQREALKTWAGLEGTFYACDDYSHEHGSYWRVVDGTFRAGGAGYDTVGYVHDTRPGRGTSPYPEPDGGTLKPVFRAFAGGEDHRRDSFGPFCTLDAALAVIGYQASQTAHA